MWPDPERENYAGEGDLRDEEGFHFVSRIGPKKTLIKGRKVSRCGWRKGELPRDTRSKKDFLQTKGGGGGGVLGREGLEGLEVRFSILLTGKKNSRKGVKSVPRKPSPNGVSLRMRSLVRVKHRGPGGSFKGGSER